ncbi:MAG: thioesterase domain-containing protein, partial [Bacteroidales bacterium]
LLGITGIGIDDNFFEIGGHSILAAQMLADFEKQTGKRIPLAEMFTAQTIRQLAGIVENESIKLKWSPLVEIKKGDSSLTPLFLIHGAEGNVLLYKDLVNRLNANRPIYGLQAKGLDGKNLFNYTIEEMAEDYIRAIKSVQPSGPYNLGGYCMGGSVAYEIALRLNARGERVANVFLLETYNACTLDQNQLSKTRIRDKIENIKFHFDNVKSLSGKEKITFIKKKAETAIKRTGARINKFASDFGLSNISESASYLTLTLRDINDKAQMEYSPSKYKGKVVLLRPKVSFATEPDAKFGWGDFIEGELKVYNLENAPRGMLTEPFVKHTAQIIESELNN